jgi:hypothetical protein
MKVLRSVQELLQGTKKLFPGSPSATNEFLYNNYTGWAALED